MKMDEFYALPLEERPWPKDDVESPARWRGESDWQWKRSPEWKQAVKAMFMLKVGNWLTGAAIMSSERDLEKLTERAVGIVTWFQERGSSCRVRISQGDYGWLTPVRQVECCVFGENVVTVVDVPHSELRLT
jgi:hypothetical protein